MLVAASMDWAFQVFVERWLEVLASLLLTLQCHDVNLYSRKSPIAVGISMLTKNLSAGRALFRNCR